MTIVFSFDFYYVKNHWKRSLLLLGEVGCGIEIDRSDTLFLLKK
jgi:hypothetical protein